MDQLSECPPILLCSLCRPGDVAVTGKGLCRYAISRSVIFSGHYQSTHISFSGKNRFFEVRCAEKIKGLTNLLPKIGDLENSALDDCTSQILSSHFYLLNIPLSLILIISAVLPNICEYDLYMLYLLSLPLLCTHLNDVIFHPFLFAAFRKLSYAFSSAPIQHDTCTPIPCVIDSSSSLISFCYIANLKVFPTAIYRRRFFCKYYSLAFAVHTRLADGLA